MRFKRKKWKDLHLEFFKNQLHKHRMKEVWLNSGAHGKVEGSQLILS
jgi:hypothetical protein